MKMYHTVVVVDVFKMRKRQEDIDKELEKYRPLIDRNYVEESEEDFEKDIMKFCLKKKFQKDISLFKKIFQFFFNPKK